MKLYSPNKNSSDLPEEGTEEEMESTVDKLIETSEIQEANDEKILNLGASEKLPRAWFSFE